MPTEPAASPWRALFAAIGWYALATLAAVPPLLLDRAGYLPRGLGGALTILLVPLVLMVPVLRAAPVREWLRLPSAGAEQVVVAFLLVLLVNSQLLPLLPLPVPVADIGATPGGALGWELLRLAGIAFAAPLAEELFFRGWLWSRLSQAWPPRAVAVATCLAFAAAHGQYAASVLPIAVALTWLRLRGGGLRAPLALHLVINTLAAAVTLIGR